MSEASDHNLRHVDMQYCHIPREKDLMLSTLGLTIIHPFYNEPERLKIQWTNWKQWSLKAKRSVQVVIADDHSTPGMHTFIQEKPPMPLEVYWITKDLRHNTPGCLNMGISEASTEWILIMDSDCTILPDRLDWLLAYRPHEDWVMRFHRDRITSNKAHDRHHILGCSILFSKTQWQRVGGFDEDFSGYNSGGYGHFDNDFVRKLAKAGYRSAVPVGLHITEYCDDIIGPGIQEITQVSRDNEPRINKHLAYDKHKGRVKESTFDKICRFKYERTY